MPDLYPLIRPVLRLLPAEAAHELTLRALESGVAGMLLGGRAPPTSPELLGQTLWGRHFPNPIGLAAGFDKDARAPDAALRLGFGFVEIGTVTPLPQPGNPKPRLFRLDRDRAVINRMGFNSGGLAGAGARLRARSRDAGIVGVNLGKNRDSADAAADYLAGLRAAAPYADYLAVNISSPNTPGLRDLQRRAPLAALLGRLLDTRGPLNPDGGAPPLLVKIAPDLSEAEQEDIAAVALASGIDGIIIANTTIARPPGLKSRTANEAGGLSGPPLRAPATALLASMRHLTGGRLPLIGVGGIASPADAYARIRAGASLVQLYTALVYEGPGLVARLTTGLAALLRADGFAALAEAVGKGGQP